MRSHHYHHNLIEYCNSPGVLTVVGGGVLVGVVVEVVVVELALLDLVVRGFGGRLGLGGACRVGGFVGLLGVFLVDAVAVGADVVDVDGEVVDVLVVVVGERSTSMLDIKGGVLDALTAGDRPFSIALVGVVVVPSPAPCELDGVLAALPLVIGGKESILTSIPLSVTYSSPVSTAAPFNSPLIFKVILYDLTAINSIQYFTNRFICL